MVRDILAWKRRVAACVWSTAGLWAGTAQAFEFSLPMINQTSVDAVLNTTVTAGGAMRIKGQSVNLVSKGVLNPDVCEGPMGAYQLCQGLFKDQIFPAQHLARAPGQASSNFDDGDLNYNKGAVVQAVAKVTQDISLTYGNFGFFGRALFFYDGVNNDFTENHPNELTADNYLQYGRCSPITQTRTYGQTNNTTCTGATGLNPGYLVYGPGGPVHNKRSDGETLRQAGSALQLLDSYVYGKLPIPFTDDKNLTFKLGRQLVNWGESTTLVLNSLNQANPVNANNLYRVGAQVEEIFTPINQLFLSAEPFDNTTIETYYQLEWKNIEIPAPGTFFSTQDIGTSNAVDNLLIGFGNGAESHDCSVVPGDNPLAGITTACGRFQRVADLEPRTSGQYGIKLDYYADWLGSGTDLAAYFQHYHSRLPYLSFYSAYPSCARAQGNNGLTVPGTNGINVRTGIPIDATNTVEFFDVCNDVPALHSANPTAIAARQTASQYATSSALALSSARFQLVYPEDIDLLGLSFNTTVGDYSIQGEVAYRPNLPLQIAPTDLAFAAFGPTLTNCHQRSAGCSGSVGGTGSAENGMPTVYGGSDFTTVGSPGYYPDSFDLAVGEIDGPGRSFPNFVVPYRGGVLGENQGCFPKPGSADDKSSGFSGFSHPYYAYNKDSPCYIAGFQREQVYQFNLGTTRVLGASDNPIGADQIVLVTEVGATYVPYLPSLDQLQFSAPGVVYHASAGADGSGANGSRQACSASTDCVIGADGLRFNPHQQDPTGFPDKLSWGYRVIGILNYENVLPQIGVKPFILYKQDIQGTSPGPGGNFVAGRKELDSIIEVRYRSAFSVNLGYTWYWGGGVYNDLSDRDFAQAFVKYQF
jgi:hypothetical protein